MRGPGIRSQGIRLRAGVLFAAALGAFAVPVSATPRLLLESPDLQVYLDGALNCGQPVQVRVESKDPAVFSGDSATLQSGMDAARAILGFECRDIPGIEVSGRIAGLAEESYHAVENPDTGWMLQASRTTSVAPAAASTGAEQGAAPTGKSTAEGEESADYQVRALHLGIGVDEAMDKVRQEFQAEPRYDSSRHLLSVVDGGCAIDGEALRRSYRVRPGDSCLEARFGGRDKPHLRRLRYAQVVDQDQSAAIHAALVRRYGQPAQEERPESGVTRMAWGEKLSGDTERRELEATIAARRGITTLEIDLTSPAKQPRYQVNF